MKKVLIVDDEKTIRFALGSMLEDAGYEVTEADRIADAKSILASKQFNVAIVDRLLGSDNGLDLIEFINRKHFFCTTILISAFPTFQSASEGFKHNLFDYLKKPIRKAELYRTVGAAAELSDEKQKINKQLKLAGFQH